MNPSVVTAECDNCDHVVDPEKANAERHKKWANMTCKELRKENIIASCLWELFESLNRPFFQEVHLYHQFSFAKALYAASQVSSETHPREKDTTTAATKTKATIDTRDEIMTMSDSQNHLIRNPPTTASSMPKVPLFEDTLSPPFMKRRKRADSSVSTEGYPSVSTAGRTTKITNVDTVHSVSHNTHVCYHRTWGFILQDLASLAPYMTCQEYEWTCFLASLCFLFYLVPNCTMLPYLSTHVVFIQHKMKRNTQQQQQQQPSEWAAEDTIAANTSYHGTQKDTTTTTNNTDAVPIPYLLSLDEIIQALFLPYLSTHHHHHHSPQNEQQDKKNRGIQQHPPVLNIGPLDDLYYASFLHFVHDGLAPWLQSRSLFTFYDT